MLVKTIYLFIELCLSTEKYHQTSSVHYAYFPYMWKDRDERVRVNTNIHLCLTVVIAYDSNWPMLFTCPNQVGCRILDVICRVHTVVCRIYGVVCCNDETMCHKNSVICCLCEVVCVNLWHGLMSWRWGRLLHLQCGLSHVDLYKSLMSSVVAWTK